jgi:hypothetical protein
MKSIGTSLRLALVAALALTPARAGPLGNDPSPPPVIESPPTFGSCAPPISAMSSPHVGSQGADFTLTNASSTRAQDALTFNVIVNGQPRFFWVPVDLPPHVAVAVSVHFLTAVQAPVIGLCGDHPVGIVDMPDPVLTVTTAIPISS